MAWFRFETFLRGHWQLEYLNWLISYHPVRGTIMFLKRPWPNAKTGLPASKQKSFHIPLKRKKHG